MPSLSTRTVAAGTILLAWTAGIVVFARKEMHRSVADRLVETALRVAPGARYYAIERNGQRLGFSSSTVDTLARTLQITEYRVADLTDAGVTRRTTEQTVIHLSRGLELRDFAMIANRDSLPRRTHGWMVDDSTMAVSSSIGAAAADTQRVRVGRGTVLPALVPLVIALGASPLKVGLMQTVSTVDPASLDLRSSVVTVAAESTFILPDSAVFDVARAKWTPARLDTVHAWRLHAPQVFPSDPWIDELGQRIAWSTADGLTMRRTAYELAFENWRLLHPRAVGRSPAPRGNVMAETAVHATGTLKDDRRAPRRVILAGVPLGAFDLGGYGQSLRGDTVTVQPSSARSLMPSFTLPPDVATRQRFVSSLGSAPYIETDAPAIRAKAARLSRSERDPAAAVRRIIAWMADSLQRGPADGVPSALQLLRDGRGDVDAHAELFVALARAAGIPARTVTGLLVVDDAFYPHAWAEVFLQGWVPVDPAFVQFPATTDHIRLLVDGAAAFDDFQRAIAPLRVTAIPPTP